MGEAHDVSIPGDPSNLQERLLAWYAEHKRAFPWRETTDPYAILVLEVMSQQTQLSRVETAWTAFLERWPSVEALAHAGADDVIAFWSTHRLGYNRRATYLHEAACIIVEAWDGTIPREPSALETLPGVGPYTANAVASFAFNAGGPVVDTNVRRVLHRLLGLGDPDASPPYDEFACKLFPAERSRAWNNAIMDLGATICTTTPTCDADHCPWREWCRAYALADFRGPDVPSQAAFAGSRRQFRGRIVRTLSEHHHLDIDAIGRTIRVDYDPASEYGREWLRGILTDLEADGLVTLTTTDDGTLVAALAGTGADA